MHIKKIISYTIVLALLLVNTVAAQNVTGSSDAANTTPALEENRAYAPGQLLVRFADAATIEEKNSVRKAYGLKTEQNYDIGYELMSVGMNTNIERIVMALSHNKHIKAAQPNYIYQIPDYEIAQPVMRNGLSGISTDDTYSSQLWGLELINAPGAWEVSSNEGSDVIVAVIDTGIMINHVDLQGNIWTNGAELNGVQGVDDDGNGKVDDINGWNVLDENGDIFEEGVLDTQGYYIDMHGTHVAGTIAAVGNNGIGVIGVAPKAKIMPIKFFGSNNDSGRTSEAIEAIEYATDNGAHIINASWGGGGNDTALKAAIEIFPGVFVAAAGNDGINTDLIPHYPSSYDSENILSVASVDLVESNVELSSFSNYGTVSVDVAAPGGGKYSLVPLNKRISKKVLDTYIISCYPYELSSEAGSYISMAGTSMATPHVSGILALMLSADGDNPRTASRLISDLKASSSVYSQLDMIKSSAMVNAYNAITYVGQDPEPPTPNPATYYSVVENYGYSETGNTVRNKIEISDSAKIEIYTDSGHNEKAGPGITFTGYWEGVINEPGFGTTNESGECVIDVTAFVLAKKAGDSQFVVTGIE